MIYVFLGISLALNIVALFLARIAIKRLIQYDKMLRTVGEDIETNIDYLNNMFKNHVSTNAPEILDLDRNLKLMRDRFVEVATAIGGEQEEQESNPN